VLYYLSACYMSIVWLSYLHVCCDNKIQFNSIQCTFMILFIWVVLINKPLIDWLRTSTAHLSSRVDFHISTGDLWYAIRLMKRYELCLSYYMVMPKAAVQADCAFYYIYPCDCSNMSVCRGLGLSDGILPNSHVQAERPYAIWIQYKNDPQTYFD